MRHLTVFSLLLTLTLNASAELSEQDLTAIEKSVAGKIDPLQQNIETLNQNIKEINENILEINKNLITVTAKIQGLDTRIKTNTTYISILLGVVGAFIGLPLIVIALQNIRKDEIKELRSEVDSLRQLVLRP